MNPGRKWLADFNTGKTQLVSFDRNYNTGVIDVKMGECALEKKSSFTMLGFFKIGALTLSLLLKMPTRKLEP